MQAVSCLQVAPFYLQLDNEAKDLRELPAGVLVSMSGKTVDFSAVPDTAVIQVTPSTGFKVPPVGNSQVYLCLVLTFPVCCNECVLSALLAGILCIL